MPSGTTRRDRRTIIAPPVDPEPAAAPGDFARPRDISGMTALAGAGSEVFGMVPPIREIPDEFFGPAAGNPFVGIQLVWEARGFMDWGLRPRPGIDEDRAIRHVMAVQRSIGLPAGYKTAAVSYLMSLWFQEPTA